MKRNYIFTCVLIIIFSCVLTSAKPKSKNHDLLTKIGFAKIRSPNHHKKRLAVESRHHTRSDDSHMFVIKLPPSQHFYGHNLPNSFDHLQAKNIPVGFKSNGKPAKVYHWNIPVMKKIATAKQKSRTNDFDVDFHNPEAWNEVLDKPDKELKDFVKSTYYVPVKNKKNSLNDINYFSGNGKPHSFYVINKSKKAHYHRLLP